MRKHSLIYKNNANRSGFDLLKQDLYSKIGFKQSTHINVSEELQDSLTARTASNIQKAFDYASQLNPSATNKIIINLHLETYTISEQIEVPEYVYLIGSHNVVYGSIIQLDTLLSSGQAMFVFRKNSEAYNITFNGKGLCDYCIIVEDGALKDYIQCWWQYANVSNVLIRGNSLVFMFFCTLIDMIVGCEIEEASSCFCSTTGVFAFPLSAFFNAETNRTGIAFKMNSDAGNLNLFDMGISFVNQTLLMEGGTCTIQTVQMQNNTVSGIGISGGQLKINACIFSQNTLDINITDNSAIVNVNSSNLETDKIILPSDKSNVSFQYFDESIDNSLGQHLLGSLIIGDKTFPSISYFGEGAFNVQNLSILKYDGSNYTDVSNNLLPSVATPTTIFNDLNNSIFYVGDSERFSTMQIDVSTKIDLGGGSIEFQYWNGSTWIAFNIMNAQCNSPYLSYANNTFNAVECQDIRFDVALDLSASDWVQNTVNSLEKYWIRIVIISTITTSPIIDTLKLIGNSSVIKEDGTVLYYGKSRVEQIIPFEINSTESSGAVPGSQDIWLGQSIGVGKIRNSFNNSNRAGLLFFAPPNSDTSSNARFVMSYISSNTSATQGTFEFTLSFACVSQGELIYDSSASASGNDPDVFGQLVFELEPNQTNGQILEFKTIEFPVSRCFTIGSNSLVNGIIGFNLERSASDNNNSNNCLFLQYSPYILTWKSGNTRL